MLKISHLQSTPRRTALAALAIVLLASAADAQAPTILKAPVAPKEATPLRDEPTPAPKASPSRSRRTVKAAPKAKAEPKVKAQAAPSEGGEYLGREKPLTAQQRTSLAIAGKWREAASAGSAPPVAGADGAVVFAFGGTEPTVICAVLQVCDVELQAGEQVNSINLGDSSRWLVTPAVSGPSANEVQHLVLKPMDVGLSTSLIVTTDRRTYHLALVSRHDDYMPRVAFSYPADTAAQWANLKLHVAQQMAGEQARVARETAVPGARAANGSQEYLANLRFNYTISGEASWKPARVFNDGVKTVIEMPSSLAQGDAPTLLVVRKGGSVNNDADTTLVNYRVQEGRYIVDQVFDEAVLVVGVGNKQQRVTIVRGN
jgi:P-type conjugative transfer protein TrbG